MDPWPLSAENVMAFAASLKQGGYKSAGAYFQVICTYQQRELRTPVPQLLRQCIRDYLRSIQRGLGVDKLKDSFNLLRLGGIPIDDDEGRFCLGNVSHSRDMCIICGWFMLRESEISSARLGHLSLHAQTVTLAIPLRKTDIQGHMTERSLSCSCRVRRHPLCVWHAAERHLIRMRENLGTLSALRFPLFPTEDGRTPGKHQMVAVFRRTIGAAGIPLEKQDGSGRWVPRFHGHVLRVSGAQMLAGAGVSTQLIQLLGRWKSTSVLRYTQDAGLAVVPDLPHMVLNAADAQAVAPDSLAPNAVPSNQGLPASASTQPVVVEPLSSFGEVQDGVGTAAIDQLRVELGVLKEAVYRPPGAFVVHHRSRVAHIGCLYELSNPPTSWKTQCGWNYGRTNFLRVTEIVNPLRQCRRCFHSDEEGSQSSHGSSSHSSSLVSSSDYSSE